MHCHVINCSCDERGAVYVLYCLTATAISQVDDADGVILNISMGGPQEMNKAVPFGVLVTLVTTPDTAAWYHKG